MSKTKKLSELQSTDEVVLFIGEKHGVDNQNKAVVKKPATIQVCMWSLAETMLNSPNILEGRDVVLKGYVAGKKVNAKGETVADIGPVEADEETNFTVSKDEDPNKAMNDFAELMRQQLADGLNQIEKMKAEMQQERVEFSDEMKKEREELEKAKKVVIHPALDSASTPPPASPKADEGQKKPKSSGITE